MKIAFGIAALAAIAGVASAHTTYLDPFGLTSDVDPFFLDQGFHHLDFAAVEVSNHHLNEAKFELLVNSDIAATNWGKFLIYFDTAPGGRTDNPWGRNVVVDHGSEFFIGGWADQGGGAELYQATATGWDLVSATYNPGSLLTVDLANASAGLYTLELDWTLMGFSGGEEIGFDFVTTGGSGSDPGVDHISLNTIATPNWTTGSVGGEFVHYHVEPAPGSIAVLGIAGLVAGRRRRA